MKTMRKTRRLSESEKEILIGEISSALGAREHIQFAYIFGSFVSDEAFKDIDIGIFVSGDKTESPLEFEIKVERELEGLMHVPVDVRVLNNAPLSFVYNVLKAGVVALDRDPNLRADFEGLVFKKYFDFRHLRSEYLREITHAPV